ncbi:MAG TPA: TetR/AcrR family transcriptional regulator [Gemmatimonadaceae bacterium]|nr:TetR/AcrR family transcriptional regulator [Gemmatimonadaceae bacterium]
MRSDSAPSPSDATLAARRQDAPRRILRAAVNGLVASGAASLTMQAVAVEAGVSKGLIHYHFHDRETLVARAVEWMADALLVRAANALAHSTPRTAVDDLWAWLAGELERGHLRVLVQLADSTDPLIRRAVITAARVRRARTAQVVETLFTLLGLQLRIAPALLADVVVAFEDGLVMAHGMDDGLNARAAFDVFWLSALSLAE